MELTDFPQLKEASVVENGGEKFVVLEITGKHTLIVDPVLKPGYGEEVYLFNHPVHGVIFMDPFSLRDCGAEACATKSFKIVRV